MEPKIPDRFHPRGKFIEVINNLRLNKLSACCNFFCQAKGSKLNRISKGIGCSSQEKVRFFPFDLLSALKDLFVAHHPYHLQKLDRIHIKDASRMGMISEFLMIPCKTE